MQMENRLKSATLLLAIHGSSEDDRPAKVGESIAESLRKMGVFGEVKAAFHKHPPSLYDSLTQAAGNPVIIIPMLMSTGYFAEKIFPKAFQLKTSPIQTYPTQTTSGAKKVIYTHPIGLHPGMENVVIETAKQVVNQHPFPFKLSLSKSSIALIGHGTSQHSKSRTSVDLLAEQLASRPDVCQDARAFFIEEEPGIQEIYRWDTPSKNVVVVPFMLADGPHVAQDIPLALGQTKKELQRRQNQGNTTWRNPTERNGKRIWISPPVGMSPRLPDLLVHYAMKEIEGFLMD